MEAPNKLVQAPHDYYYQENRAPSVYQEDFKAPQGQQPTLASLSLTSPLDLQFQLNRDVINPHRSRLTLSGTIPAQGAGTWIWMNNHSILSQLRLQSTRSVYPVNGTNMQENDRNYNRYRVTTKDLLKKQKTDFGNASRADANSITSILPLSVAQGNQASVDQTEHQYVVRAPGENQPLTFKFSKTLGELFPGSLFGIDADWRFPEDLQLIAQIGSVNSWAWVSQAANDPTQNAVPLPNGVTNLNITNVRLAVQVQKNESRIEGVTQFCKAGRSVPIPFLTSVVTPIQQNQGSVNQDHTIGTGLGSEVRHIHVSFWPSDRTLYRSCDCTSIATDAADPLSANAVPKVLEVKTKLDSRPLQYGPIDCTAAAGVTNNNTSDFEWGRKQGGGDSAIYQNRRVFQSTWHFMEDFSQQIPVGEEYKADVAPTMQLGGLPISGKSGSNQVIYNFSATLPANNPAETMLTNILTTRTMVFYDDHIEMM